MPPSTPPALADAPGPAARPGRIAAREMLTYRLVTGLSAVAILAFGRVYHAELPSAHDPWSWRVAVSAACVAVLGLSFAARGRGFLAALYALFLLVTGWVATLMERNDFAPEYALGLGVIVAIVSGLFRHPAALVAYGAVVFAMVGAVAARVPEPRTSPLLFACYLVVALVLFYVVVRNRLRAEREIAASEERYALAALGAHDGLWDWDVASGTVYYSPRWKEILGYGAEELDGTPAAWLDRVHPEDAAAVEAELSGGAGRGRHLQVEHRVAHRDGGYRWVLARGVRVAGADGAVARMAGSLTDVSERKRFEETLRHEALHDSLTGLPNRALFLDRLEREIARTRREPEHEFAVVYLDLDRFKVVNDRLGHPAADRVLVQVARRLETCLREGDSVARLGGDEFGLLLPGAPDPSAAAARVQEALRPPFVDGDRRVSLSASLGVALSSTGFGRPEDALRDADAAMYLAKARGRARCEVADAALHARSLELLEIESGLRDAVDAGELRLHFQPVVRMDTRELVGFEALMRWEHPQHGLRSPDEFIPVAEQTGLIVAMGRWALREGCRQMQAWRRAHPGGDALWLSVNLSRRQFLHPELVEEVLAALADTGLPADRLRLEITESAIIDDPEAVGLVLHRLRAAGIRVAIDDFGTGYSSLACLHRLPLDTLKIDRSFVQHMRADPALEAVIRTVISLSGSLKLDTVAEGVETDEEAAALQRLGCRLGQGFLYSHPLRPDAAGRLVAAMGSPAAA